MNRQVLNEWKYSKFSKRFCCRNRRNREVVSHELLTDDQSFDEPTTEMSAFDDEGENNDNHERYTRKESRDVVLVDENEEELGW